VNGNPFVNPDDETVRKINADLEWVNDFASKAAFLSEYIRVTHPEIYAEALQAWHNRT
jgi:hypothetical protein